MHESYYKPIEFELLRLKTDATMGEGRGNVCLPDTIHPLMDGKRCYITGWGPGLIHESMFCAGFEEATVDACQGDSGGPMVCEFNGKWYLEGATSWGHGCAAKGKYGVYAKFRYLMWIHHHIEKY